MQHDDPAGMPPEGSATEDAALDFPVDADFIPLPMRAPSFRGWEDEPLAEDNGLEPGTHAG